LGKNIRKFQGGLSHTVERKAFNKLAIGTAYCQDSADEHDDLPRIGGGHNSPINPHSGISGGAFV